MTDGVSDNTRHSGSGGGEFVSFGDSGLTDPHSTKDVKFMRSAENGEGNVTNLTLADYTPFNKKSVDTALMQAQSQNPEERNAAYDTLSRSFREHPGETIGEIQNVADGYARVATNAIHNGDYPTAQKAIDEHSGIIKVYQGFIGNAGQRAETIQV